MQPEDTDINIWFRLPYTGVKGVKKLKRCLKKDVIVKFVTTYDTNKISYYTNNKDNIPLLNPSFAVYEFKKMIPPLNNGLKASKELKLL